MNLGQNLNNAFGNCYAHNLSFAINRKYNFQSSAKSINLKYQIINSILGSRYIQPQFEIILSHMNLTYQTSRFYAGGALSKMFCILTSMSKGENSCIICDDDDVEFIDISLDDLQPTLPQNWHIIILGSIDYIKSDNTLPSIKFVGNNELVPWDIYGSQCIAINSTCYFKVLTDIINNIKNGVFGDNLILQYARSLELNIYKLFPNITYQNRVKFPVGTNHT